MRAHITCHPACHHEATVRSGCCYVSIASLNIFASCSVRLCLLCVLSCPVAVSSTALPFLSPSPSCGVNGMEWKRCDNGGISAAITPTIRPGCSRRLNAGSFRSTRNTGTPSATARRTSLRGNLLCRTVCLSPLSYFFPSPMWRGVLRTGLKMLLRVRAFPLEMGTVYQLPVVAGRRRLVGRRAKTYPTVSTPRNSAPLPAR